MNESGGTTNVKKQTGVREEKGVTSLNECYCLVVPLPAQSHVDILKHKKITGTLLDESFHGVHYYNQYPIARGLLLAIIFLP